MMLELDDNFIVQAVSYVEIRPVQWVILSRLFPGIAGWVQRSSNTFK